MTLRPSGPARRDIAAILKRSFQEFGLYASLRYRALIRQALLDIEADSQRPGSRERPDIMAGGVRTYHISLSRARVSGERVKEPRHFYCIAAESMAWWRLAAFSLSRVTWFDIYPKHAG